MQWISIVMRVIWLGACSLCLAVKILPWISRWVLRRFVFHFNSIKYPYNTWAISWNVIHPNYLQGLSAKIEGMYNFVKIGIGLSTEFTKNPKKAFGFELQVLWHFKYLSIGCRNLLIFYLNLSNSLSHSWKRVFFILLERHCQGGLLSANKWVWCRNDKTYHIRKLIHLLSLISF